MNLRWRDAHALPILDFDIETRRVGFHSAGKFSPDGCEPVAIAASWTHQQRVHCWLVTEHGPEEMLRRFRAMWDAAGIVTGHYIRKFDLPILNGAMLEHGLPLLTAKLTSDTQGDLTRRAGLSASQENLGLMLGLEASKFHMADNDWRAVARLEPKAMAACRRRVTDDVKQHKELRTRLAEARALKMPRRWAP